ncbi:Succinylglutamate desuccinylase [gamma proteobacterium IMCC1989]|nr:Succinylglutamate desuccinylase [gamma proteobacterium IMCC1989]
MTLANKINDHEILKKDLFEKGFLKFTLLHSKKNIEFNFETEEGVDCKLLDNGVLLVEPKDAVFNDKSVDIVLSCGIHGNETGPIEMLSKIIDGIIQGIVDVKHRVLFIFGNPQSAVNQTRFIEENLNRLFNPKRTISNSLECRRAARLMLYVDQFFSSNRKKIHYDFHTAIRGSLYPQFIIYPHKENNCFDYTSLSFFKESDVETVLLSHQPSSTFSYFSSHYYAASAFTIELGSVNVFGDNDEKQFDKVLKNLLILLSSPESKFCKYSSESDYRVFQVKGELMKKSESFTLHVGKLIENFQTFPIGYRLSSDVGNDYIVSEEGEAIVFPNESVPVGQRAGLVVKEINL